MNSEQERRLNEIRAIELTPMEVIEAIEEAKRKKHARLKHADYWPKNDRFIRPRANDNSDLIFRDTNYDVWRIY